MLNNTNPLINLVLQCISNIGTLIAYYFNPAKEQKILQKSIANPNRKFLGPSFLKLLDNLWKSDKEEYSPKEIHGVLNELMLQKYNSNDPGVIMNFILNQLDSELILNRVNNNVNDPYMQFNEKESLQKYVEIMAKNKTKISESFFSTIKMQKYCPICQQISYFFSPSPVINIYLETLQNDIGFNDINLELNLYAYLTNEDNKNIKENCIICGCETKKNVVQYIYTSPEIIIFNINRNKDPHYKKHFKYPMYFDGNRVFKTDVQLPNYELTTVIKKVINNNIVTFIAYCKSFIDNKWYIYFNHNIEILNNQNELIDDIRACLLIYTGKNKN
jgi:hypothetical protein